MSYFHVFIRTDRSTGYPRLIIFPVELKRGLTRGGSIKKSRQLGVNCIVPCNFALKLCHRSYVPKGLMRLSAWLPSASNFRRAHFVVYFCVLRPTVGPLSRRIFPAPPSARSDSMGRFDADTMKKKVKRRGRGFIAFLGGCTTVEPAATTFNRAVEQSGVKAANFCRTLQNKSHTPQEARRLPRAYRCSPIETMLPETILLFPGDLCCFVPMSVRVYAPSRARF